jgi:hypothetical protein
MSYIPSRPFIPSAPIMLMPGDKLENLPMDRPMRKISIHIPQNPVPEIPKKKDPRTFIGWALKAFID